MTQQAPAPAATQHRLPDRCGVVGGGRMGAGIAHALLLAGSAVTLVERDAQQAHAARERVERAVRTSVERGTLAAAEPVLARLDCAAQHAPLCGTGRAVEAVPEQLEVKVATLRAVEDATGPTTVIASNTSSISLDALSHALALPERMLGLHFFNPVPASRLVEVVLGTSTAPELRDRAVGWGGQLGKPAVVVRDSPGFASSRLGLALGLEAIRMVEEDVASPADIDEAMVLGYR